MCRVHHEKCWTGEAQAGVKIFAQSIDKLTYADNVTHMAESKEELKSLVMKVKVESEKLGENSTFRKLKSWYLIPPLHGKWMGKQWKQ